VGWLRDSMRQSRQPHRSFGAVARAALAHPEWPKDSRPQARSLASLLSKIDRGIELEWLADRPAVQHVLAEVLSTPRAKIASVAGAATARADEGRVRLRLDDLPFASPLDLAHEALPPGIPSTVLRPATWSRTWWLAPSGSGRSLAGGWLAARGLATYAADADYRLVEPRLPPVGPVFVELWSEAGDRDVLPPSEAICIAAPFLPSERTASAWNVIESDPPSSWIEALVHWLALRLPRDGHFVPERALEWLRRAIDDGALSSLGSALGLAGLVDQYGVADIERRGLSSLARRFVTDRVQSVARDDGEDAAWLGEHAPEVLERIGARLLTDSPDAADAPRTFEEWVRLVPPEYHGALDAEWVRLSLARRANPPTVKELELALRELPPGAFRVVRSLERAGLLRHAHGDLLKLAPRWLAERTLELSRLALVRGTPEGWGQALLSPRSAGPVLRAVLARATETGDELFDELLETENPSNPEDVTALETGFRIAGIAILGGVELPAEILSGLWDRQIPLTVDLGGLPHPRVGHDARAAEDEPLLDLGAFHLAALALSELLPEGHGEHPLLGPWTAALVPPGLTALLDSIWSVVRRVDPDRAPWALEAFALVDRLRTTIASRETEPRRPHALEWPGRVLDAIVQDALVADDVALGTHPVLVRALLAHGRRRGMSPRVVIDALWRAWVASPSPLAPHSPLSPSSPLAEAFYADAPPHALGVLLSGGHVERDAVPYGALPEPTWRALLQAGALRGNSAACRVIPVPLVTRAVLDAEVTEADLRALWARAPEAVDAALELSLRRSGPLAWRVVNAAPPSRTAVVVARLRTAWLSSSDPDAKIPRAQVRAFLHERVRDRTAGWREAFELLGAIA
jgi:hypothetical protein